MSKILAIVCLSAIVAWIAPASAQDNEITVYVAERVITLDPGHPSGTAVAVRDGRIAAVGSLEDMVLWTDKFPSRIDTTFKNKILLPGFVAAHEHPLVAANTILRRPLTAYYATPNPFGDEIAGVKSKEEALARIREFVRLNPADDSTVFSWGYDVIAMGGHLSRRDLDSVSTERPILVWDASVHFAYGNTAFLVARGITTADAERIDGIDLGEDGEPNGQFLAVEAAAFALRPEIEKAMVDMRPSMDAVTALNRQHGITTTTELSFGVLNREFEESFTPEYFNDPATPMRIVVVADVATYEHDFGNDAVSAVRRLAERNTDRVVFNGVKFFADDAFLGLAMALREPGYIDPRLRGLWNTRPEDLTDTMAPWWEAGFRLHIHTNGDAAQDAVIAALADMQRSHPRFDHRFVFEHFGLSTPAQIRKMKTLGATASVNPSYVHLRGDMNAQYLGRDRAALAARLGTLVKHEVPTAMHSDLPVSPADPLLMMWIAVNRLGQSGEVLGAQERVSVEQALRMVTIDAAYVLGVDDRIGSIEPGKFADFAVLDRDPLMVPSSEIRDVAVWGTVFDGKKYPAPEKSR